MRPSRVFNDRPNTALIALKVTSVTPMVKVAGAGGTAGAGAASAVVVVAAVAAAGAAAFGGGEATTITVYLLNSSNDCKKSTRSCEAFFSTIAHLTPFRSSNSW